MIRDLETGLGIPAEILIQKYDLNLAEEERAVSAAIPYIDTS